METIHKDHLEAMELVQVSDDTYALQCNHKLFYIGVILFRIIQYLKDGQQYPEIQARVADEFQVVLTPEKFDHILRDTLAKITKAAAADAAPSQSYVYGQVKLIGPDTLHAMTRWFSWLFSLRIALPVLAVASAVTALFAWQLQQAGLLSTRLTPKDGLVMVLSGYLFFAVVGMFHELGHATAAARYGIRPKEVGFGFYLVLPVLYTDVSQVWMLGKYKRILVNVSGVYFQLLVNIVLFAAYQLNARLGLHAEYVIISFFLANSSVALYSLNPFFRNDGYWIYSDLFNIPNLAAATNDYPRKSLAYLRSRGQSTFVTAGLSVPREIGLLVYTLARLAFISSLSYLAYSGFYHSLQEMYARITQQGQYAHETLWERGFYIVKIGLFCVLFVVLMYRTLKPLALRLWARLHAQAAAPEPVLQSA